MKNLGPHIHVAGVVVIVAALAAVAGCNDSEKSPRAGAQAPPGFPVEKIEPRTVTLTSSYPATLQGYQTVEIRPRVEGYIEKILVENGDQVRKGEVLFELDSRQYEQDVRSAKADIQSARAGVASAKTDMERLEPLVAQDIISEYRLDAARDTLQAQRAALAQAKAKLENAQVNLDYTSVKSPANGVVGDIPYKVGSLVSSTVEPPLTTVSDISKVYAYFSMSERQLLEMTRSVPSGAQAGESTGGGPGPTLQQRVQAMPPAKIALPDGTTYDKRGDISLASGLIDPSTGTASFRALFPNPNHLLRTGGAGTIRIPFERKQAITVPKKATYELQNKRFVYTVDDQNKVHSTEVEVLSLSTQDAYVVKKGVGAGDTIVTAGMQTLQDGQTITPERK